MAPKLLSDEEVFGQTKQVLTDEEVFGQPAAPGTVPPVPLNIARREAIADIESGGRYDVIGPPDRYGDRPHGKYQIMGKNIGPWSEEALGRRVDRREFMAKPEIQDEIFDARFGNYAAKYGEEGAARAWIGGEGSINRPGRRDSLGTSVGGYGQRYRKSLQELMSSRQARSEELLDQPAPAQQPTEQLSARTQPKLLSDADVFGDLPGGTTKVEGIKEQHEFMDLARRGDVGNLQRPVEKPPVAPTVDDSLGRYPVEFGKGVARGVRDTAAVTTAGIGFAVGGFPNKVLDQMARIDRGERVTRNEDSLGYQDMSPEQKQQAWEMVSEAAKAPIAEQPLVKAGQAIQKFGQETIGPAPGWEKSWTGDIGAGFGSLATSIALGRLIGGGPATGVFAAGGMGEAGLRAIDKNATPEQVRTAAQVGAVPGMTEFVDTLFKFGGGSGRAVSGMISKIGVGALKGAFMEGGQEGVQQVLQNAIEKGIYNPEQDLGEDVIRSAIIGAITGSVPGGIQGGMEARGAQRAAQQAPASEEEIRRAAEPPPGAPPAAPPFVRDSQGRPYEASSEELMPRIRGGSTTPSPVPSGPVEAASPPSSPTPTAPAVAPLAPDTPSVEPWSDIRAQLEDLQHEDSDRRAVYITKETFDHVDGVVGFEQLDMVTPKSAKVITNFDGRGGILVARDEDSAARAMKEKNAGIDPQITIGRLTGWGEGKPADGDVIVEARDGEGAVVAGRIVRSDERQDVMDEFASQGWAVSVVTPQEHLQQRQEAVRLEKAGQFRNLTTGDVVTTKNADQVDPEVVRIIEKNRPKLSVIEGGKSQTPEAPLALKQDLGTIKAKPGIGFESTVEILGQSQYGKLEETVPVTVKELFQNSFDAVKESLEKGQTEGNIDIRFDKDNRTITFLDDGAGMSPDIVAGPFVEVAASGKGNTRKSGGLGIAKIQTLYGNKSVHVTTMRDGVVSEMFATGTELRLAGAGKGEQPDVRKRTPTLTDHKLFPKGHGTQITITVPKEFVSESTGETIEIPFPIWWGEHPSLRYSPLFSNINVKVDGSRLDDVGKTFDPAQYPSFLTLEGPWGKGKLYVSKDPKMIHYGKNLHVLSNGIWQFSSNIKEDPSKTWGDNVPRVFYLDIQPGVAANKPGYPFAPNRQQFSPVFHKTFGMLFQYLSMLHKRDQVSDQALNFGGFNYLETTPNGVRKGDSIEIKPKFEEKKRDRSAAELLRYGAKVEIQDDKAFVEGKELPPLKEEDLKNQDIGLAIYRVDQKEINVNTPILHDNTLVEVSELEKKPITQLGAEKFGPRFNTFMNAVGKMFMEFRDQVATHIPEYSGLKDVAVGVSFDLGDDTQSGKDAAGYRGVYISLPFEGMFINPAAPKSNHPRIGPAGIVTTMAHEAAHYIHKSEEDLTPYVQEIWATLGESETFDFVNFKNRFVALTQSYGDIYSWLVNFHHGKPFNVRRRGNRLEVGNVERGNAGSPVGAVGRGERTGEQLSSSPIPGLGGLGIARESARRGEPALRVETRPDVTAAEQERNSRTLQLEARDPDVTAPPPQPETASAKNVIYATFGKGGGRVPPGQTGGGLTPSGSPPSPPIAMAIHADRFPWLYKYMLGLDRLVDRFPMFTPLVRFYERASAMHRDEARIQDLGLRIAKQWRSLGSQAENLTALLDDVANMTYRTDSEKKRGVRRHPTQPELQDLVRKHAVSNDAMKVYNKIKASFDFFLDRLEENAIVAAQRELKDPVALAKQLDAIRAATKEKKKAPYFPFMRFGTHWVKVKDPNGNVVHFSMHERRGLISAEGMQRRMEDRVRKEFPTDHEITHGIISESSAPYVGMPPELLDSIAKELDLTPAQQKALEQIRYDMAPAASFKHQFQQKNFIEGYSDDFLRAYSRYFFHGARYYAKTKHAQGLRDDLKAAQEIPGNAPGAIANYMEDYLNNVVLDSKGDYGMLKGFIFLMTFGFSVAGALINLSQVPGVTMPFLAAKFGGAGKGDAKAAKAVMKAMTDVTNFYRKGTYDNSTEFQMRAFAYGIKTGRISESQASELAGMAQGHNLLDLGKNKLGRGVAKVLQWSTIMFEGAEQFNRRVTFRAALELATNDPSAKGVRDAMNKYADEYQDLVKTQGFTPAEASAVVTAIHATEQTQFVYAKYARPRLMRGRMAGTILVFKHYLLSMMLLMGANKSDVMPRMLLFLLGATGMMGLPGAEDMEDIAHLLGKWMFGKDFKFRIAFREFMKQFTDGSIAPDLLLHGFARKGFGLPALLDAAGSLYTGRPGRGLGSGPAQNIPFPVTDMSRSLGMGRLVPLEMAKFASPGDTDRAIAEQSQKAVGPIFGYFFNIYKFLADKDSNWKDRKDWERIMPRAGAGISRGFRVYSEGRERVGSHGPDAAATILPYNRHDPEHVAETIAMGLGFQPTRQTGQWDFIRAKRETEEYFETSKGVLLSQFAETVYNKDPEERKRVIAAIKEYNQNLPQWAKGMSISDETVKRSMETRVRTRTLQEMNIPTQKSKFGISKHIQELFPESTVDVRKVR